jgi:hypothetical protein
LILQNTVKKQLRMTPFFEKTENVISGTYVIGLHQCRMSEVPKGYK